MLITQKWLISLLGIPYSRDNTEQATSCLQDEKVPSPSSESMHYRASSSHPLIFGTLLTPLHGHKVHLLCTDPDAKTRSLTDPRTTSFFYYISVCHHQHSSMKRNVQLLFFKPPITKSSPKKARFREKHHISDEIIRDDRGLGGIYHPRPPRPRIDIGHSREKSCTRKTETMLWLLKQVHPPHLLSGGRGHNNSNNNAKYIGG